MTRLHPLALALLALLPAGHAAAQAPDPGQSQACLVSCPGGDATALVVLRDAGGQPVPGVEVLVNIPDLVAGPLQPCEPPTAPPHATTDAQGQAQLTLPFAGWAQGGVQLLVDDGNGPVPLYNNLPLAGVDLDASRYVDGQDEGALQSMLGQPNPEADYDCSGQVDAGDLAFLQAHIGHGCDSPLVAGLGVEGFTMEFTAVVDSAEATFEFSSAPDSGQSTARLVIDLAAGPGPSSGSLPLTLQGLGGAALSTPSPLGESGIWRLSVDANDLPVVGGWEADDSFSIGPFDLRFACTALDSVTHPTSFPDTTQDFVETTFATLQCTLSGTMSRDGDGFEIAGLLRADPQAPAPALGLQGFRGRFLIDNRGARGGQAPVPVSKGCKRFCQELCVLPVILAADDGTRQALSLNEYYQQRDFAKQVYAGACVRLDFRRPLVLKKTGILDSGGGNPKKRTKGSIAAQVRATPEYQKFFGDQLKGVNAGRRAEQKVELADCVTVVFTGGTGIAHPSGAYADLPGDKVLINFTQADTNCARMGKASGHRLLAHELGHTMGLRHTTGTPATCMHACATGSTLQGAQAKGSRTELRPGDGQAGQLLHSPSGKLRSTRRFCCYGRFKAGRTTYCEKVK